MVEHSPIPWRNIHGRIISDVMPRDGSHDVCSMTVTNNNHISAEANAELIVKAVNNHDALVAALRELYAQVQGECPSLLTEDSGGDARLHLEIQAVLSAVGSPPRGVS